MSDQRDIKMGMDAAEVIYCKKAQVTYKAIEEIGWTRGGNTMGHAVQIPDELMDHIRGFIQVDITTREYQDEKTLTLARASKHQVGEVFEESFTRRNSVWQFRIGGQFYKYDKVILGENCRCCGEFCHPRAYELLENGQIPESVVCDCAIDTVMPPHVPHEPFDQYEVEQEPAFYEYADDDYDGPDYSIPLYERLALPD
jgi:hypothetical protein